MEEPQEIKDLKHYKSILSQEVNRLLEEKSKCEGMEVIKTNTENEIKRTKQQLLDLLHERKLLLSQIDIEKKNYSSLKYSIEDAREEWGQKEKEIKAFEEVTKNQRNGLQKDYNDKNSKLVLRETELHKLNEKISQDLISIEKSKSELLWTKNEIIKENDKLQKNIVDEQNELAKLKLERERFNKIIGAYNDAQGEMDLKVATFKSINNDLNSKKKNLKRDYDTLIFERKGLESLRKVFEKDKKDLLRQREIYDGLVKNKADIQDAIKKTKIEISDLMSEKKTLLAKNDKEKNNLAILKTTIDKETIAWNNKVGRLKSLENSIKQERVDLYAKINEKNYILGQREEGLRGEENQINQKIKFVESKEKQLLISEQRLMNETQEAEKFIADSIRLKEEKFSAEKQTLERMAQEAEKIIIESKKEVARLKIEQMKYDGQMEEIAKSQDALIFKVAMLKSIESDLLAKAKSVNLNCNALDFEKKGLESLKNVLEKEKLKFASQQESFKLAVKEAKKRWMLK